MSLRISLQPPEYYLNQLKSGCILDPSVFYAEESLEATIQLLTEFHPDRIYLNSTLYNALQNSEWSPFLTTMDLWSGDFEKTATAWRKRDYLLKELKPLAIRLNDKNEQLKALDKVFSSGKKLSPLNAILLEMITCAVRDKLPILVTARSPYRLIELLNTRLPLIIIRPMGEWLRSIEEFLANNKAAITIRAVKGSFAWLNISENDDTNKTIIVTLLGSYDY